MGERHERTPWEQHASASGLPRFSYKPLSPTQSSKGFLITCQFDREKSATKEALSILTKYLKSPSIGKVTEDDLSKENQSLSHETCDKNEDKGKQLLETVVGEKVDESITDESSISHSHSNLSDEQCQLKDAVTLKRSREDFENFVSDDEFGIFLPKMPQKGIISILWESTNKEDPVTILSKVLVDIENGSTPSPRWCYRMVPVQETCLYSRESLTAVVIKLVKEYLQEPLPTEVQPLKYAVSFNRRGFKVSELNGSKLQDAEGPGRMSCIHLVTAAVASATPHAIVDLGAPQMVVAVEIMPSTGMQIYPICGVAVLSGTLMSTKPKLSVKALVPAHRAKK